MTSSAQRSRGASAIDVLVLLAALSIIAALAYPRWAARAFRQRVEAAISDVDAASARARSTLGSLSRWPASAPPGAAPAELTGLEFSRATYTLEWSTWDVVDSVEARTDDVGPAAPGDAPPPSAGPVLEPVPRVVGAVMVHAGETSLLAELLAHYGSAESFVLDTTWIRLLPERAASR